MSKEEKLLLPSHIYKAIEGHKTSLGKNAAFPPCHDFDFEYNLMKRGFKEAAANVPMELRDERDASRRLSKLMGVCVRKERPIRAFLEKLCYNAVIDMFSITNETIELECKLVDKVEPKRGVRVTPEEGEEYEFDDVDDVVNSNSAIEKRRLINAMVQGIADTYSSVDLFEEEITEKSEGLVDIYKEIIALNNYLLYVEKEKMSDEKPMQGAYAEVRLGNDTEKTSIEVQGLIFPLLLRETIKGLFEAISAYGLPQDKRKAMHIIRQSDFLLAEPWDMRFGKGLWEPFASLCNDTHLLPYIFMDIIKLSGDAFNDFMKNALAKTSKGKNDIEGLIANAENTFGYNEFLGRMSKKNAERSLMTDDCFTAEELDDEVLEEDGKESEDDEYARMRELARKMAYVSPDGFKIVGGKTVTTASCNDNDLLFGYINISGERKFFYDTARNTHCSSALEQFYYDLSEEYEENGYAEKWNDTWDNKSGEDQEDYVNESLESPCGRMFSEYNILTCWGGVNPQNMSELADDMLRDGGVDITEMFYVYQPPRERIQVIKVKDFIGQSENKEIEVDDKKQKELHLLKAKDKWNATNDFRYTRDKKNAEKLGKMPMAQYHSLIYQESVERPNGASDLLNCDWKDISFEEGETSSIATNMERIIVKIRDEEIPSYLIDLNAQMIRGGVKIQLHINLDPSLRGMGLGTKIYRAFLHWYGALYSAKRRMTNPKAIEHIYNKLEQDSDVEVTYGEDEIEARLKQVKQ